MARSSGSGSESALEVGLRLGEAEIVGLLTDVTETEGHIPLHGAAEWRRSHSIPLSSRDMRTGNSADSRPWARS